MENITLSDLKPYTTYTVTVKCKSPFGGRWSNEVVVKDRTKSSGHQNTTFSSLLLIDNFCGYAYSCIYLLEILNVNKFVLSFYYSYSNRT